LFLDLEVVDGGLKPTVVATEAEAHLLEEPVADAPDDLIEQVVAEKIPASASGLLGGAAIELPDIGGALVPIDAAADPGGRYIRISY
jgi:hypothetical protein